ncbi:Integral membrane protein SED5 [Malassezia psittaci]|uniref:Integral membrane protein SED5 n=1 Tax=Malassezia psittaci TaxID=1821823 RepID=A0AAF0JF41_9BASI|nr:Integral membrane protein SED5 [Malassezia psittaci]
MAYRVGPPYSSSVKDRTSEYLSAFNKYAASVKAPPSAPQRLTGIHAEFTQRAQAVSRDLSATTAKLDRLSQRMSYTNLVARSKSLFNDRPVEISELTYIIKHDLANLNRQLAELQSLTTSSQRGARTNRADEHRGNVVTILQTNLANTTNSFQEVLEIRTQNMKASKDRSEQFLSSSNVPPAGEHRTNSPLYNLARNVPSSSTPTPSYSHGQSVLQKRSNTSAAAAHDDEQNSAQKGYLALNMMETGGVQQQQMLLHDFEDQQSSYVQQRSNAIESIESTISELGQIFGQLAHMVAQQGETVQRIDEDVMQVSDHVEGARRELLKYYVSISNNRWLMLKIFGVLIIFFLAHPSVNAEDSYLIDS